MSNLSPGKRTPVESPVPALREYYADAEGKRRFTRRIFDSSAPDYDRVDRLLAFGSGSWYRRQALLRSGLAGGMRMLDVAVGTGLVAREAVGIVGERGGVIGVDPSAGMLAQSELHGLTLARGRAEALPFAAGAFDFLCLGYALRHLADLETVFREFRRVLRPGGRMLVLEITRPEGRVATAVLKAYLHGVLPALARLVAHSRDTPTLYRYYWDTIEACVPPARIMATLAAAGFAGVSRNLVLGIFSEYSACAA
ncbi:MAG: class I SAM-dependent methyltransferase [Betaproteobacteria bacterium]|nr:class I SAM-dependent methyltransferase [Betaproteobacteria bacterium]